MDPSSPNDGEEGPQAEAEAKISKCFHLYNCDKTYKFDSVEKLLESIKGKLDFDVSIAQHYFHLREMSETCERLNSERQMDFAIFVIHAHESRLSINEDNAGIGYAKIYRALLEKTDENVIIVIGGDDNYKNSTEEQTAVLSRWAYRKVSSQFDEQFLDGRKSFIFSWDKKHRPVHEEAILHFFDPNKKGEKFVPEPKVEPTVPEVDPKKGAESHESSKINADETSNVIKEKQTSEGQEPETSSEQRMDYQQDPKQMDEPAADNSESVGLPQEQKKTEEDDDFVKLDIPKDDPAQSCPSREQHSAPTDPQEPLMHVNAVILYRDQSDIASMRELFGDELLDEGAVTIQKPSDLKEFFSSNSVGSCFMFIEAKTMQEELQKRSHATPYEDLVRTVREKVGDKVVIIICYNTFSQIDGDAITVRIKDLLVNKDVKILWKQNAATNLPPFPRSGACPSPEGQSTRSTKKGSGSSQAAPPINPEDLTLLLKTRLRHGEISYDEKDVEERVKGWTAPQKMADELLARWQSIVDVELRISRNTKTGDHHIVVDGKEDNQVIRVLKGVLQSVASYNPEIRVLDNVRGAWQSFTSRLPLSSGSGNTSLTSDDLGLD